MRKEIRELIEFYAEKIESTETNIKLLEEQRYIYEAIIEDLEYILEVE